jgi:two-component system chemotaxis sensor kinase CheA
VANRVRAGVNALASSQGKNIRFCMEGLLVRLDRSLLESLVDPLLHIMRNAIDHGIESEHERKAAGKQEEGTITLRLSREGNEVRISIEDDGRGMRPVELRNRAVALNLMSREQADGLSDRECHFLVTLPGFSTLNHAGDVSGRGVGMDVVRHELEALGGRLEIGSRPGAGTVFTLEVPQSMAIIQALLVRCRKELFAVPATAISRTMAIEETELIRTGERVYIAGGDGEDPLPAIAMNRRHDDPVPAGAVALLPFSKGGEAILVDEVVGHREVLVRPLDPPLRMLKRFSGAAMLGDGSIALVIDPQHMTAGGTGAGSGV